ncbi:hypothetical protein IHE71_01860 [Myceligenerans sp. TRM 65318]|uniref:Uncharacterized protein n=2 Tax=Myceligenerans pegani TaxID=2776917 RepID=A0ABR9MSV7_9MICO|nr:hypothetical protein [Myceligenerans sp. TRM 65318]MBE3016723.1 hypothetical protein [Myceligenerans sp. TRM 65318]
MNQEIITAVGNFSTEVVARVIHQGAGWMLVGGAAILAAGFFISLAMFLRADPQTRRDIIDLVHGPRKSIR